MNFEWIERACPLCGSTDTTRVFAESNIAADKLDEFAFASRKLPEYMHARLIECPACGLLYTNPALSLRTLAQAYNDASFDSGEEAQYASLTYAVHVRRIARKLPRRHAALDIGTGDGAFLERLLEIGFDEVIGVEPSPAPIDAAKPEIRSHIRHALFRPEDFAPACVSLVSCFQTMEHVSEPLELARGVQSLLEPGGAFVIVVHNRKAVSARILGMKSPIFDVEHLQLFCPTTAKRLLEHSGYERVHVQPLWNSYPLRYWLRLFPMPNGAKRSVLAAANASGAGRIHVSIPAGNLICVGYKPAG